MGHLGRLDAPYRDLVKRLENQPVSLPEPEDEAAREAWRQLLEIYFTPEHARVASRMPVLPSKIGPIADRVGMAPEDLEPVLDAMCDKGLVMDWVSRRSGNRRYMLSPPVVGFFEFSMMRAHDMFPKKELADALHTYMFEDRTFADRVFAGETVIGRTLVHEGTVAEASRPEIMAWEQASRVVAGADKVAVTQCYCRHKAEHNGHACDAPQDVCLSMGTAADFLVRRGFAREITKQEALGLLEQCRDLGLVHIADNTREQPTYICNCCSCCCGQLSAINRFDLDAVSPSGYQPGLVEDLCVGCSRCARACPVGAISMVQARVEDVGKRKSSLAPAVDPERCIGCGVCATTCPRDALEMVATDKPYIPSTSVEQVVRMALERGNLADLLFDEGASRGHAFLNRALKALTSLPAAERALASEQVKSRFVRVALGMVRGTP